MSGKALAYHIMREQKILLCRESFAVTEITVITLQHDVDSYSDYLDDMFLDSHHRHPMNESYQYIVSTEGIQTYKKENHNNEDNIYIQFKLAQNP